MILHYEHVRTKKNFAKIRKFRGKSSEQKFDIELTGLNL